MRIVWKKWLDYDVEGAKARGRPNKSWKEVVDRDMRELYLESDDAMM